MHLHASTDNDSVDDGDDHLDHHHHHHDLVTDVIKSASDTNIPRLKGFSIKVWNYIKIKSAYLLYNLHNVVK